MSDIPPTALNAHSKPIRLAAKALAAAMERDNERAMRAVVRIHDECGWDGLSAALMAWCDTYIDHATDGKGIDRPLPPPAAIKAIRTDTGQMQDASDSELPPRVTWAAAVIQARAQMDSDRFMELLAGLPSDDGVERAAHVRQVLDSVALSLTGLPRGFALGGGVGIARARWN